MVSKDNEEELMGLIRGIEKDTKTLSIIAMVSIAIGAIALLIAICINLAK